MFFHSLVLKAVVGVSAAATAGAVGIAHASTPSNPNASNPNAANRPGHAAAAKGHALLRHLEHGELTVKTKDGDKTYDLQSGTIASVDATLLEVTSADGFVGDYTVSSSTKVRVDGKPGDVGSLAVGDQVMVLSDDGQALRVRDGAGVAAPRSGAGGGAPGANAPTTSSDADASVD